MAKQVGINGFGRIGRAVLRLAIHNKDIDVVAINDLTDPKTLAHLLKYDSVHGLLDGEVSHGENSITVNGKTIKVLAERDPAKLPWKELGVGYVLESTGLFTKRDDAAKHLAGGARKVLISAPATDPDLTVVLGVNHSIYNPESHHIISNASCTTNCLAPMVKVILDNFGIVCGQMTTIHSYTNDQKVLDLPHKDLRRARAAALSMIPTTTGAARAVGLVIPEVKGILDGLAIRVPTANVSLVDLTVTTKRPVTSDDVNNAMREAAAGPLKGVLKYTDEPLVSSDYNGDLHSCIFDSPLTKVLNDTSVKVFGWYDNESAYSQRAIDVLGIL